VLTVLVLLSMGGTGFFVWKNWDKMKAKSQPEAPVESTEDLKARIRGGN
jgi:nicotinamide riboside transporter PnuC